MPYFDGMSAPLIITQLLLERAEIEALADPLHIVATVRLFDPTVIDRSDTAYHGATKAMRRLNVFALHGAALEASSEPPCTHQIAWHVITAEHWDMDHTLLRLTVSHEVGATMKRMSLRGVS